MEDDLKRKVKVGLSWAFTNQLVTQLALIAINIYLTRILTPSAFGVVGMITIFSGFALFLVDGGFASALIHRQDITQAHLSTVFWVNILVGCVLYGLFFVMSQPIAKFYEEPLLQPITQITGLTFIFSAFGVVQNSLLVKEMAFKTKAIINWISLIVGYGTAIVLAQRGYGVWSIVWLNLANSASNSILLWVVSKWTPSFIFSWSKFKSLFSFGANVLGDTTVNYWSRNTDNFLIGKYVGSEGLGLYSRAYTIMLLPVRNISAVIARVMFPAFSSIQHDLQRIRAIYLKTIRYIAIVTFPAMFGLVVLAEEFVLILFGEPWIDMIPIVRWLSVLGAFQSIVSLNGVIYNSVGRANIAFRVSLIVNAILIVSFSIGVWLGGVMGVTIAYFIAGAVLSIPIYARAIREIKLPLMEALGALSKPFIASIVMVIILLILSFFNHDKSSLLAFIASISLGCIVYVACLYLIDAEFRRVIKTRKI